jgi:hypothetical protein
MTVPHQSGGAAGQVPPWRKILGDYWEARDWVNGIPTKQKLLQLGLENLAREVHPA